VQEIPQMGHMVQKNVQPASETFEPKSYSALNSAKNIKNHQYHIKHSVNYILFE